MKRLWMVCLSVMLLVLLAAGTTAALAAEEPIKIEMEMSTNQFTGPATIDLTIRVTNVSNEQLGMVALYYPDGQQVAEFGSEALDAGQSRSWSGTWDVTAEQLSKGRLTFGLVYPQKVGDETVQKQKNFSKALIFNEAEPQVDISRVILPNMASKDQTVSITYEIANVGTVDITNVTIKENSAVSSSPVTIAGVAAGEKVTHTFTVKMGTKDITSAATITFKAGSKTGTAKVDEATVKYGEVKLTASVKADKKGGTPGDTVKLTVTLKNTGKSDFENITVSDAVLGEVFTGVGVAAGKTVTLEKEVTVTETTGYQFSVRGTDASGNTVETATGRLEVVAVDATKAVVLEVKATADRETIYTLPGVVRFKVYVTNNSAVVAEDVDVVATGVTLYNFESIQPGETRSFIRDVSVPMAGKYLFEAHVENQLDETDVFESEILQINYAAPTPVPTEAPIVTPPAPKYEEIPTDDGLPGYVATVQSGLSVVYRILMVLTCIGGALLLVGVIGRVKAGIDSAKAQDHLQRGRTRNYVEPSEHPQVEQAPVEQEVTRPIGEDKEPTDIPEVQPGDEAVTAKNELMEETLRNLYPREQETEEVTRNRRSDREE